MSAAIIRCFNELGVLVNRVRTALAARVCLAVYSKTCWADPDTFRVTMFAAGHAFIEADSPPTQGLWSGASSQRRSPFATFRNSAGWSRSFPIQAFAKSSTGRISPSATARLEPDVSRNTHEQEQSYAAERRVTRNFFRFRAACQRSCCVNELGVLGA